MIPSAADAALARARACHLLGGLFLTGPTPATLPALATMPDLGVLLGPADDVDELAADHHAWLQRAVHPYQSFFLEPEACLGGAVSGAVTQALLGTGFDLGQADGQEADHLGVQLLCLAHLFAAEADAHRDGAGAAVAKVAQHQVQLLDVHVLRWLPALVLGLDDAGAEPYATAARLALELLLDRRSELPGVPLAWTLPGEAPDLADPRTGLDRIAAWLASPARFGALVGRERVRLLGREHGVPAGFGTRRQGLQALLHGAARYGRVAELCRDLQGWVMAMDQGFVAFAAPTELVEPWRARLQASHAALDVMARGAAEVLRAGERPSR